MAYRQAARRRRGRRAGGGAAAVVLTPVISALGRQRQADLCEFEASLVYKSKFQDSQGYTEKLCFELAPYKKILELFHFIGKYVVFFFYPLDFTFVCPTEIIAFSDRAEEFKKLNCQVIGASVDSHFCHLAWINTPRKQGGLGPMNIPLVSDPKRTIAQDYGVLKADEGISFRGLFIIDDKGILRQITINDLPVGRSVDEILRLVQAFQFTDKHGEVCPAGWKPGSDTIKPDVQKSKEYFCKQK
ncbi:hypothetical protein STEG23_037941 [Scotinomys teguina]